MTPFEKGRDEALEATRRATEAWDAAYARASVGFASMNRPRPRWPLVLAAFLLPVNTVSVVFLALTPIPSWPAAISAAASFLGVLVLLLCVERQRNRK